MAALPPGWTVSTDGDRLKVNVSMGVVIDGIVGGLIEKVDDRILKTCAWVERLVVRAHPEDDPAFDAEAQREALYFLRRIRELHEGGKT